MSPRSPLSERIRRRRGRLIPAALVALAPKCLLCLLGYAGLGAAWGLGAPELCGAGTARAAAWPAVWSALGAAAGAWVLLRPHRS
jgi:hypothetical protein